MRRSQLEWSSSWSWCNCLVQIDEDGYGVYKRGNKRGNSMILSVIKNLNVVD